MYFEIFVILYLTVNTGVLLSLILSVMCLSKYVSKNQGYILKNQGYINYLMDNLLNKTKKGGD